MRSSSFFFPMATMLSIGASVGCDGCGDDETAKGSGGGGDTTSTTSADASTSVTSGSGGSGGDLGAGTGAGTGGSDATSSTGGSGGSGEGGSGTGGQQGDGLHIGRVLFANDIFVSGDTVSLSGSVGASFAETVDPGTLPPCEETIVGDCTLILCPAGGGDPPEQEARKAGDFTIGGTELPVELTDEGTYYSFYESGEYLYAAGADLTVSTTGDEVPAFDGSVAAPGHAIIDSPSASDLTFSRDEELPVTWSTVGDGGRLLAYLSTYAEDGSSGAIYCDWPLASGQEAMPAELMTQMPASADASLTLYDYASTYVVTGPWSIEIAAQGTPEADTETGGATFTGIVLE